MTLSDIASLPDDQQKPALRSYLLDAAQAIFRELNISEIHPDARGGVFVKRGYGPNVVEGYADTLSGAIQKAIEKEGRSL